MAIMETGKILADSILTWEEFLKYFFYVRFDGNMYCIINKENGNIVHPNIFPYDLDRYCFMTIDNYFSILGGFKYGVY